MTRALIVLALAIGAVAAAAPAPAAFSHRDHAEHDVAIARCETCHAVDPKGQVVAPGALGHAPCLSAGCHAKDFIATGAAARKADPAAYAKATALCLGCHASQDGTPPAPWSKPAASAVLESFRYEREYHVEMNHFEHTGRAGGDCRVCHVVDARSFALVRSAPGHAQCVTCHNPAKFPQFTMAMCGLCHDKPARAEYFQGTRPKVDVRACGSEGQAALAARGKHAEGCFRHERAEHRVQGGEPVQCAACHYMIGDQTRWGRRRYQTLLDLHVEPVIDNAQDREHKSCGRTGACHKADVDVARTGARCSLCHAEKSAF